MFREFWELRGRELIELLELLELLELIELIDLIELIELRGFREFIVFWSSPECVSQIFLLL